LPIGGTIKVTAHMAGRWVKAAFLVVLGIVILLYSNGLVEDLKGILPEEGPDDIDVDFDFETIWELLTIMIWILVAWLFVLAALNIALSFQEAKYSLAEVMKRLDRIDTKLGIKSAVVDDEDIEEEEEAAVTPQERPAVEEDIPPPPSE
jgi:hypothetical protein